MEGKIFGCIMLTVAIIVCCTPFVLFGVKIEDFTLYAPQYLLLIGMSLIVAGIGLMGYRAKKSVILVLVIIGIILLFLSGIIGTIDSIN